MRGNKLVMSYDEQLGCSCQLCVRFQLKPSRHVKQPQNYTITMLPNSRHVTQKMWGGSPLCGFSSEPFLSTNQPHDPTLQDLTRMRQ